jgi:hypothetical protein
MAEFPLDPQLAKMVVASPEFRSPLNLQSSTWVPQIVEWAQGGGVERPLLSQGGGKAAPFSGFRLERSYSGVALGVGGGKAASLNPSRLPLNWPITTIDSICSCVFWENLVVNIGGVEW